MKIKFAQTIRNYDRKNLGKDLVAGLIIMAVSIPISMGYAQIAGLPAVYGLYGSVFPILLFALFSTSPQFIFGVDAAPAALIGAALLDLHIESGSKEALAAVPVLTAFVALWLFAFYVMRAGKLVNYISAPVMGGFITGICTTIILMQVPKLLGGTAGTGEFFELVEHIAETVGEINLPGTWRGCACDSIDSKKGHPEIPDGGAFDGSGCSDDKVSAPARLGHQDAGCRGAGTSGLEPAGFYGGAGKGGGYDQPVGGGRHHGGDAARRK